MLQIFIVVAEGTFAFPDGRPVSDGATSVCPKKVIFRTGRRVSFCGEGVRTTTQKVHSVRARRRGNGCRDIKRNGQGTRVGMSPTGGQGPKMSIDAILVVIVRRSSGGRLEAIGVLRVFRVENL